MLDHVRAGVAYIAGRIISGSDSSYVYDYSQGKHISISGSVDRDSVSVYDYTSHAHIGGSSSGIYHYGERSYINLTISGHDFTGYDYGTQTHFSGNVSGNSISLYDYQLGRHFSYTT